MSLNPLAIFSRMPSRWRSIFYKYFYRFLARKYRRSDWKFMNYGFAPLDAREDQLDLDPEDEYNRVYIQLYHHLASFVPLEGREVLEVGCGRGGGADYIRRYLDPCQVTGLDLSDQVIEFCGQVYNQNGLSFKAGNAESLPFPDGSFDVVLNVESSHCYASVEAFFGEVRRVLRDSGHFLLADFRRTAAVPELKEALQGSGLTLISEEDITSQILNALSQEEGQRAEFIQETIPGPLAGFSHEYAGTPGSRIYQRFDSGESVYLSFVLQKPVS